MIFSPALRDMGVFLTLADELHYGRTAERLGLTPSRISQIIRLVEAQIGARLFDRTSRQVRLTPIGEELRRRIAPLYEELLQAYAEVREQATGITGTLRLGLYSSVLGGPHLLDIIKTFESRHPTCRVRVTETGFHRDQIDWLRRDELDVLVLRPFRDPEVVIGPTLTRQERLLAVAADHPLARRESVSVEDLADYTTTDVETLPREIMDAFSPPVTPSGRPIQRAKLRSIGEAVPRVATGELVHPTTQIFFEHFPHPRVVAIPIRDLAPAETVLVWLRANRSSKVAAFAQAAADVMNRDEFGADPDLSLPGLRPEEVGDSEREQGLLRPDPGDVGDHGANASRVEGGRAHAADAAVDRIGSADGEG
jgi:DNA-binding transcriptional LysR family regulator